LTRSDPVGDASQRIKPYIQVTPLEYIAAKQVYIKWENRQTTGSFKLRGACNKILTLSTSELERGLTCASAGNHGQAVGWIAGRVGASTDVFVSKDAPRIKLEKMRSLGVHLHLVPGGYGEAEAAGLEYARLNGKTWISPYNDPHVILGAATIAAEVLVQANLESAVWLVPVGGGGLISGIGEVLKHRNPGHRLIGVQPQDNAYMRALVFDGSTENWRDLPSLADGLTGAVEGNSVTVERVQHYVDEILLVSEADIAQAIAYAWLQHGQVIEGSGAVALAAMRSVKLDGVPAIAVISGGNIDPHVHAEIIRTSEDPFLNEETD